MKNRWSDSGADECVEKYAKQWGEQLALRTYTARLIGAEKELVLHGGGNTSVKVTFVNALGERVPAVFVKASGQDLAGMVPEHHTAVDLERLRRLRALPGLPDRHMLNELMTNRFDFQAPAPSLEALLHALLSPEYVDHTHADSILALTNRSDAESVVAEALGPDVLVLDYVRPGFELARVAAACFEGAPSSAGMVLMKHGIVTWGATARESYERMIELVTRAEAYLAGKRKRRAQTQKGPAITAAETAEQRYLRVAPVLRGLLAIPSNHSDRPRRRFILQALTDEGTLSVVDSKLGKPVALTPPLTTDHLVWTKPLPLWIDDPLYDDETALREQLLGAIDEYARQYDAYFDRHSDRMDSRLTRFDSRPRVILMPGLGAVCVGKDIGDVSVIRDITARTLEVKMKVAETGEYQGLSEEHLFDMEYHVLQHAKLEQGEEPSLQRSVALVTGAAGAIGSAICEELLQNGCHVAAGDLPGRNLDSLVRELKCEHGNRIIGVPMDVTAPGSVAGGFDRITRSWGGIDLVVVNAGLAHASLLAEMDVAAFRKLEQVNVEGTLHVLSESARRFKVQGTGGDVVLISTKNVFAPGAGFGAYSASKAAAHQLARIASLEFAQMDVRVNMVAPDAVFAHGERRSGLWAEVGPDRMRARGLDEAGLEEYYRNRNLLKAKVTATHVAKAVMFFATRQTPTTGATIPVDGGLPDATPR
ncbi:MAG: bifunctional aldolase/short-chain dehydrogenase [Candidatus Eiseniibacteriota bacterium]|nr:MAG: bifunctional aldolase/short-chain dehydrogenase [Candidatus Eisenbacteria bacterium]